MSVTNVPVRIGAPREQHTATQAPAIQPISTTDGTVPGDTVASVHGDGSSRIPTSGFGIAHGEACCEDSENIDHDRSHTEDPCIAIYAIVVAVDVYASPEIQALEGCEEGAKDLIKFLLEDLRVPSGNIVTLFNQDATCSGIIQTINNHFAVNPAINQGDELIFYFAGRGSCTRAPKEWENEQSWIDLLCPHDFQRNLEDHASSLRYGIGEYALQDVIANAARNKGDNITVILDCCYFQDGGSAIQKEARSIPPMLPCTIQAPHTAESSTQNGERRDCMVRREFPLHPTQKGMASCVTLAACRPTENAREQLCPELNVCRGVFTANLISKLRAAREAGLNNLTYSGLHPQCDGPEKHRNRVLFSACVAV